jgi:hypothetical protein
MAFKRNRLSEWMANRAAAVIGWYRIPSIGKLASVIVGNVTAWNHIVGEEVALGTITIFMRDVSKTVRQDSGKNTTGA